MDKKKSSKPLKIIDETFDTFDEKNDDIISDEKYVLKKMYVYNINMEDCKLP